MTYQQINFGSAQDGHDGDTVRGAFDKTNQNWALADQILAATWVMAVTTKSVAGSADVVLAAKEANVAQLVLTGALTGNINVIVPAVAGQWTVKNNTTGAFTLALKTQNGVGVVVPQGVALQLVCDGTNVTLANSGDVVLAGTGRRFKGDFGNPTLANRPYFQPTRTNDICLVGAMPDGTGSTAGFIAHNNPNLAASAWAALYITGNEARIISDVTSTSVTYAPLTVYVGGDERARVTPEGRLLVGARATIDGYLCRLQVAYQGASREFGLVMRPAADVTRAIAFLNAAGTEVGSIVQMASSTSYNTTSDYRLKTVTGKVTNALATLRALPVYTGFFNVDPEIGTSFLLAHEVQELIPSMVHGDKDAVEQVPVLDEAGQPVIDADTGLQAVETKIKPQVVDYSRLGTWNTAAIQELAALADSQAALIQTMANRLAALEGAA